MPEVRDVNTAMMGPWWCPSGYEDRHSMSEEQERQAENEPLEAKLEREDDLVEEEDLFLDREVTA